MFQKHVKTVNSWLREDIANEMGLDLVKDKNEIDDIFERKLTTKQRLLWKDHQIMKLHAI